MSVRKELTGKAVVLGAKEVAEALGCSNNKAYEVIKTLNKELEAKGFITFTGKVSEKYFLERVYGLQEGDEKYACV